MKHKIYTFVLQALCAWLLLLIPARGLLAQGLQSGRHGSGGDEKSSQLWPMVSTPVNPGWNLLSVGIVPLSPIKSLLYPEATSDAFIYQGSYVPKDSLGPGHGMWVKFGPPSTSWIPGALLDTLDIPVLTGWNMIGSISETVAVAMIMSEPAGIRTTNFYKYTVNYSIANTIVPGRGYWVKVNQAGTLVLSSNATRPSLAKRRITIVSTDELPPPPPGVEASVTTSLPKVYALEQNYPNPFNPATIIRYQLPVTSIVKLKIFNVIGQEVKTLIDGIRDAGYETATLDASTWASGVYFYKLEAVGVSNPARSFTQVKKLMLIK